jgi:opacity protein-like surface antigen
MLALIALTSVARAQERDQSLGPFFGAHYTNASGTDVNGAVPFDSIAFSTNSMSGGGITIGYGIARWLSAYATMDLANGTAQTDTGFLAVPVTGSMALNQVDAGFRLQLPLKRLTPYAVIAYSSRFLDGHQSVPCPPSGGFGGCTGTYTMWGHGFTYGAGLEFFFAREWAADVSWQQTSGTYERLKLADGATFASGASSTSASRFLVGVNWHTGPQAAPSAPIDTKTPLENGQLVRVYAGTEVVSGNVAFVGRDTLIVQRMVNDAPVQSAVPIACIARIEREREARPMKGDLINGAVLGAIGGALAGAVVNGQSTSEAKKNGPFFLTYYLGGAVIGAGIGAGINALSDRWEPAPPLPVPEMPAAEHATLCAPWMKSP